MKKASLFLVLFMVCGGLAAQEMVVSSDTLKSDTLKKCGRFCKCNGSCG